jgi:hypothetical protein
MTSIPEQPEGPDLEAIRKEIDELKDVPTEELIEPTPKSIAEDEPTIARTDAPGTEDWNDSGDEERTEV